MPTSTPQGPQANDDKLHISDKRSPVRKFLSLIAEERKDILFIYVYSVFTALVGLSLPLGIQGIITRISGGLIFESVYVLIGLVIISTVASGVLQIMQIRLVEILQRRIFARTAFNMTLTLLRLRFDALKGSHLPELMNRFFDVITLQKSLPKLLIDLSSAAIQILVGLILLAFYHPFFVLLTLFLGVFLYLLFRLTGPEGLRTSIKESTYKYKVAYWLEETARVIRPARLFNHAETIRQTDTLVAQYLSYRDKHFRILITQYAWIVVFKVIVIGGLLILGTLLVADSKITLGQFVASEFIIVGMVTSVEKLIIYMDTIYDLLSGTEKISHVTALYRESETGRATPRYGKDQNGIILDIRNLTASDGSGREVLRNYNAQIMPGRLHVMDVIDQETINVITDVLLSTHEDYSGVVLADGIPIRELDNFEWRHHLALYSGAGDLVAGTLESNMRLIYPDFSYPDLLMWLKRLNAEEVYLKLDLGLETPILPAGRNLVGFLSETLPLAMRLISSPRLLIVRDNIRFMTPDQKQRMVEVLAAYARQHTVVVFSGDPIWRDTANRVHDLTKPVAPFTEGYA